MKFGSVLTLALLALAGMNAGCSVAPFDLQQTSALTAKADIGVKERDCLLRAMYFESNRSSEDGLLAVGTVVMNRVKSGRYSDTICGVVGERNQFATGALTRPVAKREAGLAEHVADTIIEGNRLAGLEKVMFFHTAGLHFNYGNMHYVKVAGGNAFYYRLDRHNRIQTNAQPLSESAEARAAKPDTTVADATPDADASDAVK